MCGARSLLAQSAEHCHGAESSEAGGFRLHNNWFGLEETRFSQASTKTILKTLGQQLIR